MTLKRFLIYLLGLLLFALLGAGLYVYYNLPALVTQQAQHYLKEYGVDDFDFEQLQVNNEQLRVASLQLRGEYEGLAYAATLTSVSIVYDWRVLLSGQLQSVDIATVDIELNKTGSSIKPDAEPTLINMEDMVPQYLIDSLPVQSLQISKWNLDYIDPDLPAVHAGGTLLLQDRLELSLTATTLDSHITAELSTHEASPLMELALSLHDNGTAVANASAHLLNATDDHWAWGLTGDWKFTPLLNWLYRIDAQASTLLDMEGIKDLSLQGESHFNATVTHPSELNLSFEPEQPGLEQFQVKLEFSTELERLSYADVIKDLTATLKTGVLFEQGNLELDIETTQLEGTLNEDKTQFSLQPFKLNADIALHDPLQIETHINTSIAIHVDKKLLPKLELTLHQQGAIENSALEIHVTDSAETISADLRGTMNLITGQGGLRLNAKSDELSALAREVTPLLQHFGLMKQNVNISDGSFSLQTDLRSTEFDIAHWNQKSQLSIRDVSGSLDETTIDGLELSAIWTGIERWRAEQPITLSLQHLFVGFAIRNLRARFNIPRATPIAQPELTLDAFSAELFGGTLSLAEPRPWSFAAQSNSVTLLADQWRLADIVALQSDKDIQAEGILEGKLPVTIVDGRVTIAKGYLQAVPPGGAIRYVANDSSRALASSNPELKLALDLLSDFQYQVLKSTVELDQAGNLILGLALAGSNPSRYQGQPINFNINLEQNIDPLLQSLQLSDKLIEQIEGGLK